MAYRQLCVVAFAVLGVSAFGCGKGETRGSDDLGPIGEQSPPPSDDRPSGNSDQSPSSPEQPDSNPDNPVGGGELVGLCRELCERLSVADCGPESEFGEIETAGCAEDCVIPDGGIPCEPQFVDFFSCILTLTNLCDIESEENQAAALACQDSAEGFSECLDDSETPGPDPGGGEGGAGNGPGPVAACTDAGGCECPTACLSCLCDNAGADATECTEICSAP